MWRGEVHIYTFIKIDIALARRPLRLHCTTMPRFRGEILVLRIPWVYRGSFSILGAGGFRKDSAIFANASVRS